MNRLRIAMIAFLLITMSSILVSFLNPIQASAHVLLPQSVVQYIKENPDASPSEIDAYIKKNAPNVDQDIKSQQDVLRIVNQKTSFIDNSYDFMRLGFKHILSGFDHILFVLSLLLVFVGFRNVLKYTGSFTIAHSVTLILAGTGVLTVSSQIVEPIIAFSIAVVALGSVFLKNNKYVGDIKTKLGIVFFFGLFHGLGFAGLLQEIQIPPEKFLTSLLSFNIGIEIGQLFIVALALPFIYMFKDKKYYLLVTKVLAVLIAGIAIVFVIQRLFGIS